MKVSPKTWTMTGTGRLDWKAIRDTIDLAAVATNLLGPAPGRRGERSGRRLWWPCPLGTHDDHNPSFAVQPGERYWKCFGCGESGDAATLVMKVRACGFRDAVAFLSGGTAPSGPSRAPARPTRPSAPKPRPLTHGLTQEQALELIAKSEARLWTDEGQRPRAYLFHRGLTEATIRAARLGFTWALCLPGQPMGIVIPWFDRGELATIKLRQSGNRQPKYYEVFRSTDRPPLIYPGLDAVRPGRPLILPEGELDALLLGQELAELEVTVRTLGSASARPHSGILWALLTAAPWYIATDNDAAGDKAADGWPACARRVRPPGSFKDWTEAHQGGVSLGRWWTDRLGGNEAPPLFTWDELARQRWGPARDDAEGGIIIDRPGPDRRGAALEALARGDDPEAVAERLAIQSEQPSDSSTVTHRCYGDGSTDETGA